MMINSDAALYFSDDENGVKKLNTELNLPTVSLKEEAYVEKVENKANAPKRIYMFTV